MTLYEELVRRGLIAQVTDEEEIKELINTGKATFYIGFDCTADSLTAGHFMALTLMKRLQMAGNRPIALIGGGTTMIGDPSGRSATRPPLTTEQVIANAETYKEQVFKILDPEKTVVEFNSRWLNDFTAADFIRLGSRYTLARMMERDDFAKRYRENTPIALHELLYPLMQGYDSVALKADVEMGGTDQTFNLLVGRTLMGQYDLEPQCILTVPLLEGLDGVRKMSKSYGNYIGINEPAADQFGKAMSVSDDLMWRYYELISSKSLDEIAALKKDVEEGRLHPKKAKEALAYEIVARYHGEDQAQEALQGFNSVFADGGIPDDAPEFACEHGEASKPPVFLTDSGLAASRGEAKRLIKQGSLSLDGERCDDAETPLEPGSYVVKLGKKRFLRLTVR